MKSQPRYLWFTLIILLFLTGYAQCDQGNTRYFKKADAVFRPISTGLFFFFDEKLDHTALAASDYSGNDSTTYLYESNLSGNGVRLISLETFKASHSTYHGAYEHEDGLSISQRNSIIDTAVALYNDSTITYTAFTPLDPEFLPGTYVQPSEIDNIRCDGFLEYCYEWNNIWVWGRTDNGQSDGTPQHHDISRTEYIDEHDNLGWDQPWFEFCPAGQRGRTYPGTSNSPYTLLTTADDYYERNDTRSDAYNLSNNEQTWLTGLQGIGVQFDDDWYQIEVTSGYEQVIIDCQFVHAEGDIDIALYDSTGNFLTASESTSDDEYIDYIVAASGTYYIKVYYEDAGNNYDLQWDDIQSSGALKVNLTPQAAIDAGAQWKVDGGSWQDSGATVSGLSAGDHLIEFKTITGWNEYEDYTVTITAGYITTLTVPYSLESGSLKVNLTPQTAIDAGAQWKVNGSEWQDSGATVSGLMPGDHLVEFKTISGWNEQGGLTTQIYNSQTTIVNKTYTQVIEWTISGRIHTFGGTGISGVTMNGWPGTAPVTDSNGHYSGTVPNGWSGTITPSKDNYNFSPLNNTYSSVTSNQLSQDYTGALITSEEFYEDFETGDYSNNPWYYFGAVPWGIISDEVHEGSYGIRSGVISDGQHTGIGVSKTLPAGYITFWRKVSSQLDQDGYDLLAFSIDGLPTGIWLGEKDWSRKSYFIDEGTHAFDWMYQKDSSISDANDCGWIDDIVFEPEPVDPALYCWVDLHSYSKFENNMTVTDSNNFTYNMTYEDGWLIGVPAGGFTVTFESLVADGMELVVRHLSSAYSGCQGGGYSPVTISLNGVPIVSDYDPAENHGGYHGLVTDIWPISVNASTNTLEWTANNLCTNYWIQGVEIRYPLELVGDFDYDSIVDSNDIKTLADYWLEDCSTPNWCGGRDIDKSGLVNFVDFCRFAENWLVDLTP